MKIELEKYGIQMFVFSKIGGILVNELLVDEVVLYVVVIVINEVIDCRILVDIFVVLKNLNVMFVNFEEFLVFIYQDIFYQVKQDKMINVKNRIENLERERDVYEELFM